MFINFDNFDSREKFALWAFLWWIEYLWSHSFRLLPHIEETWHRFLCEFLSIRGSSELSGLEKHFVLRNIFFKNCFEIRAVIRLAENRAPVFPTENDFFAQQLKDRPLMGSLLIDFLTQFFLGCFRSRNIDQESQMVTTNLSFLFPITARRCAHKTILKNCPRFSKRIRRFCYVYIYKWSFK